MNTEWENGLLQELNQLIDDKNMIVKLMKKEILKFSEKIEFGIEEKDGYLSVYNNISKLLQEMKIK